MPAGLGVVGVGDRIFSAKVSGRPRRSRPSADPLGEAGVDAVDELDGGVGGDGHVREPLVRSAHGGGSGGDIGWRLPPPANVDKYRTSAPDPLPEIADDLRRRVEAGEFGAGAAAALRGGAVRRATRPAGSRSAGRSRRCASEGLVDSRQGFGWFVAADPLRQSLGRLGTIERQLADEGVVSHAAGRSTSASWPPRPGSARCSACDTVLRVRRLNLADGEPFALVTVWCPEELGAELSAGPTSSARRSTSCSTSPLGGATQTIGAAVASAARGRAARRAGGLAGAALRAGHPLASTATRCCVCEHVFPAHRTEFVVDLPHVEASIAPTGLRLVE